MPRTVEKLFGPPGTGKTERLLREMESELEAGTPAERIAFLTFTRAAREEAKGRAARRFKAEEGDLKYFRTLHSIAYEQLGVQRDNLIATAGDLKPFAEAMSLEIKDVEPADGGETEYQQIGDRTLGERLLSFNQCRRNRMQTTEEAWRATTEDLRLYDVQWFEREYAAWKQRDGLVDFTDLLERADEALPVDVVFVDEAQDLSLLQWECLRRFAANASRVWIAGDDDQAIYRWAGADPETFVRMQGRVEVLQQSYRLPRAVWRAAQRLAQAIRGRQPKEWRPRDEEGAVSYLRDHESAPMDNGETWQILARNHYLTREVRAHLREAGVPFTSRNSREVVKGAEEIIAWERLRAGVEQPHATVVRVYDLMRTGDGGVKRGGKAALRDAPNQSLYGAATLREHYGLDADGPWHEALTKLDPADVRYARAVERRHGLFALAREAKVKVNSIHGAKGEEADNVLLYLGMGRRSADSLLERPDDERRVYYVGITRARKRAWLVEGENPLFC